MLCVRGVLLPFWVWGLQCFQGNDSGSVMFVMSGSSGIQITDKTEHYIVADLSQQTELAIVVY